MRRKVISQGLGTLTVSLPSRWVESQGIVKGGEVDIEEEGQRLIISPLAGRPTQETEIDVTGLDRTSVMYAIRSLYRLGYDGITVRFKERKIDYRKKGEKVDIHHVLHEEVNRLIGLEILQEKEQVCIIKDLQASVTLVRDLGDFDQVLRRIFHLINDMMSNFLEVIEKGNIALLKTMDLKHDAITKLISYCLRMLNKIGHPIPRKTAYYFHIISTLDRIVDHIKYAARDLIAFNKKPEKHIVEIIGYIRQDLHMYSELFYNHDNNKIREMNELRYKTEESLRGIPKNSRIEEALLVARMFNIMEILLDLIEARTAVEY